MLRTRFLFVIAGLGVAMFCVTGRHVGGSAARDIVPSPRAGSIIPDVPVPAPTSWQLREALPAPRMKFDPDAPTVDVPAEAAETPPGAGDLDPTIDVQITQEIIDKAGELVLSQPSKDG